ncbi:unnamed protein product [Orchesella dallaii]|uniref:Uncharacterized protein n=1 Tax=Orchesella dallaii TaxID=48710 RepID=A0ABP1QCG7_9HEXA
MGDSLLTISSGQLEEAKQICDLSGWIRQGVLLLNGCLSSQESGPLYNAWQILINFVIRHLSNSVTKVVFVLFGEAVHSKETLINLPINFVMKLAHPDQYSQNAPAPHPPIAMTMDWNVFPPFMTSNFYLLRERGVNAIIDWKSIGTLSPGINWRVMMNARFCNDFIQWNRQAILSGQRQFAVHNGIMITWRSQLSNAQKIIAIVRFANANIIEESLDRPSKTPPLATPHHIISRQIRRTTLSRVILACQQSLLAI